MALSADDAGQNLLDATTYNGVDIALRRMVESGDLPAWLTTDWWKWVTITGGGHTLRILVAPDYAAVGDGWGYPIARETPFGAQALVESLDAILPSRKIVNAVEAQADPKIAYFDVKAAPDDIPLSDITTPKATAAMARRRLEAFAKYGIDHFGDSNVMGYRKSVVVGPNLDGSHVAIYGGRWTSAGGTVQPYSTIHGAYDHSDYSHGVMVVSRKAELDGRPVDLRYDVFGSKDPAIYGLVSDQGRFDPIFPNAGGSSRADFSVTGSVPAGAAQKFSNASAAPPSAAGASGGKWVAALAALAAAGAVWKFAA